MQVPSSKARAVNGCEGGGERAPHCVVTCECAQRSGGERVCYSNEWCRWQLPPRACPGSCACQFLMPSCPGWQACISLHCMLAAGTQGGWERYKGGRGCHAGLPGGMDAVWQQLPATCQQLQPWPAEATAQIRQMAALLLLLSLLPLPLPLPPAGWAIANAAAAAAAGSLLLPKLLDRAANARPCSSGRRQQRPKGTEA